MASVGHSLILFSVIASLSLLVTCAASQVPTIKHQAEDAISDTTSTTPPIAVTQTKALPSDDVMSHFTGPAGPMAISQNPKDIPEIPKKPPGGPASPGIQPPKSPLAANGSDSVPATRPDASLEEPKPVDNTLGQGSGPQKDGSGLLGLDRHGGIGAPAGQNSVSNDPTGSSTMVAMKKIAETEKAGNVNSTSTDNSEAEVSNDNEATGEQDGTNDNEEVGESSKKEKNKDKVDTSTILPMTVNLAATVQQSHQKAGGGKETVTEKQTMEPETDGDDNDDEGNEEQTQDDKSDAVDPATIRGLDVPSSTLDKGAMETMNPSTAKPTEGQDKRVRPISATKDEDEDEQNANDGEDGEEDDNDGGPPKEEDGMKDDNGDDDDDVETGNNDDTRKKPVAVSSDTNVSQTKKKDDAGEKPTATQPTEIDGESDYQHKNEDDAGTKDNEGVDDKEGNEAQRKPNTSSGNSLDGDDEGSWTVQSFMFYFLFLFFASIVLYVLYHGRHKIGPFVNDLREFISALSRKTARRSNDSETGLLSSSSSSSSSAFAGSHSGVKYKKLSTTVDETLPSTYDKLAAKNYIY